MNRSVRAQLLAGRGRRCHIVRAMEAGAIKAVLGPTNTGKTHLAVERLCAHSSGAIGFPLRLLAKEVYDRVVAIKGADKVALITGEERIEPAGARYRICTVEAMDRDADVAFLAVDEAQLGTDRERGHVFTDRMLNARGRDETMILGSTALAPMVKALVPDAEIVSRPRFSTLRHAGPVKLSRVPPRSAIVAFSAEQVYAVAEMLRRFRGGAAVVMGALSPQTRNAQVAMFQSGEVDYLVATDAIGMGLNLDVSHVAFSSLHKFDGHRRRRLTIAEMAQIAGRAGRHQRDGTFGALSGQGTEFSEEEIYAIEEHRFPPIDTLYWREARPRLDSLATLIADLESPPITPGLAPAPEAVDLAIAKILAADGDIAATVKGKPLVGRFWEACSLPDFRQMGADNHARFVARLWQDLSHGTGRIGHDFVARNIAELDNGAGDIDTLQGRIAAIRIWSYIAQRPDWVMQREELAERARNVETRLSDALHARLTERFVNRRTTVLMRKLGRDAAMPPVRLDAGKVLVDGEEIGHLEGFAFRVDPQARLETRRLLLAAAEKHLPALLQRRANSLLEDLARNDSEDTAPPVRWVEDRVAWHDTTVARLVLGRRLLEPALRLDPALNALPGPQRAQVETALAAWLRQEIEKELKPLLHIDDAAQSEQAGPELRALLIALVENGGTIARDGSGLDRLDERQRRALRRLKIKVGALDLFCPAMLRARILSRWRDLAALGGERQRPVESAMAATRPAQGPIPLGYRRIGRQDVRIDMAERLIAGAHDRRERWAKGAARTGRNRGRRGAKPPFTLDPSPAISMGLTTRTYAHLLRMAGFVADTPPRMKEGGFGPPTPPAWRWQSRPARPHTPPKGSSARTPSTGTKVAEGNPFAALAELIA